MTDKPNETDETPEEAEVEEDEGGFQLTPQVLKEVGRQMLDDPNAPLLRGPVEVQLSIRVENPDGVITPVEAVNDAVRYVAEEGLRNFAYQVKQEYGEDDNRRTWLVVGDRVITSEELEAWAREDDDDSNNDEPGDQPTS